MADTQRDGAATTLVLGGTGLVGGEVVRRLVERGRPVRVATRDPGRAGAASELGAEVVRADVVAGEPGAAFEGAGTVIVTLGDNPQLDDGMRTLAAAAASAGVERVVKLSVISASRGSRCDFAVWHRAADEVLLGSDLPTTIVRPAYFTQNFLRFFAAPIAAEGVLPVPVPTAPVTFTDARDVADALVALAEDASGHESVIDMTGPEALTFAEAAAAIERGAGRPVRFVAVPPEAAAAAMRGAGVPDQVVDAVIQLYAEIEDGLEDEVVAPPAALGVPGRRLEDFAAEHRAAFTSA